MSEKRCCELYKLGMKYNVDINSYVGVNEMLKDFKVHLSEVYLDDEIEWNVKIEYFKSEIKKRLE